MRTTREDEDRRAAAASDDQLAGMTFHGRTRHMRDLAVRDADAPVNVEQIHDAAESGPEDEPEPRRCGMAGSRDPLADRFGRLVDPALEL
jgi:hypothetical protein